MMRTLLMTTAMPLALMAPHVAWARQGVPTTPAATAPARQVPPQPTVSSPTTAPVQQAGPPGNAVEADLPENGDTSDAEEIEVVGQRERGSVPGDIKPEQVLRAGDIRSYGVSSISDLLAELTPQLGGARGGGDSAPVILLNGRRISGFREISALPTEAIERTEILPPEAAQQLGYAADQRVLNIVLRRRFDAVTVEAEGGGSTDGDRYTAMANGGITRIMRETRLNLNVQYSGATPVYEDDRDVLPIAQSRPYSITGNLTPATGRTTIDPALGNATVAGIGSGISGRASVADFLNPATPGDFGAYRTLASATRSVQFNGSYARMIGKVDAALSFELQSNANDSELGLASTSYAVPAASPFSPFASPVTVNRFLVEAGGRGRANDALQGSAGLTLNGEVGTWRWNVTSQYSRNRNDTITDGNIAFTPVATRIAAGDPAINPFLAFDPQLIGPFSRDLAYSLTDTANVSSNVSGPVFKVPAGDARLSVTSNFTTIGFETRALRSGATTIRDTSRRLGSGQARLSIPITSRRNDVLSAIGNLSVNGVYGIEETSDYGSLKTYGYGFNWDPIPAIGITGSINTDENAPSNAQLTNPLIVTPDVQIFDFVTGRTVNVQRIEGGNPDLLQSSRQIRSISARIQPFTDPTGATNLNLNIEYSETRLRNQISSLPAPTAALQLAFPDRYVRDASGLLIRFDNRPVNFARAEQRQLRTNINFQKRFGRPPERPAGGFGGRRAQGGDPATQPPADGAAPPRPADGDRPRGDGGGRGFGGGGFGRGSFGGQGGFNSPQAPAFSRITRLGVNLTHVWSFENSILIRDGLPPLDQLDGDVLGGNGAARHVVDFNARLNRGGYGLRTGGRWTSGSFVRGGTSSAPTDITFAPFFRANLTAFVDLNPVMKGVREHSWLNGVRIELEAANVLNARQRITAADGSVPLNFQPFLQDPIGRLISVKVRKRFS